MYSLGARVEHGISPSGRNDILELCNSLGQAGSVEMTGEMEFLIHRSLRRISWNGMRKRRNKTDNML